MDKETLKNITGIAQAIYDKKGFNILVLDLRGISSLADFALIAEGHIDRHVRALANSVKQSLDDLKIKPSFVEGEKSGDWIVIDCGEIVVHMMLPDLRERYSLEKLWHMAKIVDVKINTDKVTQQIYG